MSFELEIFNFQSISHQKLRFDGFVCLTGRGNLGKSAVFRALRACLMNDHHLTFIRKGAKECLLRVTFENEPHQVAKVERFRTAKKNSYTITMQDGSVREYPKAAENIPPELLEIGFRTIRTESNDVYNLCFTTQFDPLFLVLLGSPALTSFLNKVFGLEKFERALRAMNADAKDIKGGYDRRALTLISLGADLDRKVEERRQVATQHQTLQRAIAAADEAERRGAVIEEGVRKLREATRLEQEMRLERARAERLHSTAISLERYAAAVQNHLRVKRLAAVWRGAELERAKADEKRAALLPLFAPLEALSRTIASFSQARRVSETLRQAEKIKRESAARLRYAQVAIAPLDLLGGSLAALVRGRSVAAIWRAGQSVAVQAATVLHAVTPLGPPLETLYGVLQANLRLRTAKHTIRVSERDRARACTRIDYLQRLEEAVTPLQEAMQRHNTLAAAGQKLAAVRAIADYRRQCEGRWQAAQAALQTVEHHDKLLRDHLGYCPTCGGALAAQHLHREAA